MIRPALVSIAVAGFLLPQPCLAFGTKSTHERLARRSLTLANQSGQIASYLRDGLGLARGENELLAVQLGLDSGLREDLVPIDRPDTDAIDTRLNRSLSRDDEDANGEPAAFPLAPPGIFVPFEEGCRTASDFDTCFAALPRADISTLIAIGTYAEDNPNPRSRHHFHDPERAHGPSDNYGLDNSDLLPFRLDSVLADFIAAGSRGGSWLRAIASFFGISSLANFELHGRSAIDRALNTERGGGLASSDHPQNLFALPDAERYLYDALTHPERDQRENYMALHFIALGHVLHLLQDMGSVAHVRNDFIVDHVLIDHLPEFLGTRSLEVAGDDEIIFPSILAASGSSMLNVPAREILLDGRGTALSGFLELHQEALDPTDFDVEDFWDRAPLGTPEDTNPARAGLAERVHNRFLSAGTLSNFGGYDLPNLPPWSLGFQTGTGSNAVRAVELPERDLEEGTFTGVVSRYLASPLVPHLARCNYHCFYGAPVGLGYSVIDESVQRDYLELLFPLVIDYGAKFLQHYLAPRIEVVPTGDGGFTLRNLTTLPFQADAEAVEIDYATLDPGEQGERRRRVQIDCGGGPLVVPPASTPGGRGPLADFVCHIPPSLPEPALDPSDFWVVARGALGQRGEVGTPAEFDTGIGPKGFVVAFDHVQSQLLVHGAVANELFTDDDPRYPIDIFSIPLDLGHEAAENDVPPTRTNLTAALRESIGSATLDLTSPNGEPGGVRIALRSDKDATETDGFYLDVAAPQQAYLFDPTAPPTSTDALTLLPESQIHLPNGRPHVAPLFSGDGAAIFYYEDASFPQSERSTKDALLRYRIEDEQHARFTDRIAFAASGDPEVTPDDLDVGDQRDVCEGLENVSARLESVIAGQASCHPEVVHELPNGQKVWSSTGPFRREIRIATVAPAADEPGKLEARYTDRIDVVAGRVIECGGDSNQCWQRGGEPSGGEIARDEDVAWSPDGTRIAFLRSPTSNPLEFDQEIWIADLVTREVRRVMTDQHGDPGVPQWSPDGKWVVFGMQVGAQVVETPGGLIIENDDDIDVYALRADSDSSQPPQRLTRGLQQFSIGIYAPLTLPSAP